MKEFLIDLKNNCHTNSRHKGFYENESCLELTSIQKLKCTKQLKFRLYV